MTQNECENSAPEVFSSFDEKGNVVYLCRKISGPILKPKNFRDADGHCYMDCGDSCYRILEKSEWSEEDRKVVERYEKDWLESESNRAKRANIEKLDLMRDLEWPSLGRVEKIEVEDPEWEVIEKEEIIEDDKKRERELKMGWVKVGRKNYS